MKNLFNTAIAILALSLSFGVADAAAHSIPPASPTSSSVTHQVGKAAGQHRKRALRHRRAQRTARRSAARRKRQESPWKTTTPTPAPSTSPTPAPEPSPTPSPRPEPVPAPEPTPEPAPAPAPAPDPVPASEPAPAPQPSGSVLFSGNFDAGFTSWYLQSLASRATLVSSGAFNGTKAARFEVRDGDVEPDTGAERSEVAGPSFHEGQDLYVRDAIRIPSSNTYSGPWQIIEQLHEDDWGGSPGVALFLDAGRKLTLCAGDGSPVFWEGPAVQADRWYELVYRVNLSQSSSTGFVEVWLDGVQQTLPNGKTRIYGQTIQAAETYIKAGIYRAKASTGTSIVEHDAIAVGTSYAAVTAS